jgi:hypothetical protein
MDETFKDRYIKSLEEQIQLYKKQQSFHDAQVNKLMDRIKELEEKNGELFPNAGIPALNFGSQCIKCASKNSSKWYTDETGNYVCLDCNFRTPSAKFDYGNEEFLQPVALPQKRTIIEEKEYQFKDHSLNSNLSLLGPACGNEKFNADGCRIRKRKCDRQKPFCSYCMKLSKANSGNPPCTYPQHKQYSIAKL